MKTGLNIEIRTDQDAEDFLIALVINKEEYHPEDNAHDILWNDVENPPTAVECDKLNELMGQIYANCSIDPCEIILNYFTV